MINLLMKRNKFLKKCVGFVNFNPFTGENNKNSLCHKISRLKNLLREQKKKKIFRDDLGSILVHWFGLHSAILRIYVFYRFHTLVAMNL